MIINDNQSTNLNYGNNITKKIESEEHNTLDEKLEKSFSVDIREPNNSQSTLIHLTKQEIDAKIQKLDTYKSYLQQQMQSDLLPKYDQDLTLDQIPEKELFNTIKFDFTLNEDEIEKYRKAYEAFLDPNQKFYSEREKFQFMEDFMNAPAMPLDSFLTEDEIATVQKNLRKTSNVEGYKTIDKKNDFDSALSLIYHEKTKMTSKDVISEILNKSEILNVSNTSLDTQKDEEEVSTDIIDQIEEKVLKMSDENTNIKEKENLLEDIKDLAENLDKDFAQKLTSDLENSISKEKKELSKLTNTTINISSPTDTKRYMDLMAKYDVDFDTLSMKEQNQYITNKQNIINAFTSLTSNTDSLKYITENNEKTDFLSEMNNALTKNLEEISENILNFVDKYTTMTFNKPIAGNALDFLDKLKEYKAFFPKELDEIENGNLEMNKILSEQALRNADKEQLNMIKAEHQINEFLDNIDKLIYLYKSSENIENIEKANTKKDSLSFNSKNISQQNGSFLSSHNLDINNNNIVKLIA